MNSFKVFTVCVIVLITMIQPIHNHPCLKTLLPTLFFYPTKKIDLKEKKTLIPTAKDVPKKKEKEKRKFNKQEIEFFQEVTF